MRALYPRRRNVTTSKVGLKTATYAQILPKMVNPQRYSWGPQKKKKKKKKEKKNNNKKKNKNKKNKNKENKKKKKGLVQEHHGQ